MKHILLVASLLVLPMTHSNAEGDCQFAGWRPGMTVEKSELRDRGLFLKRKPETVQYKSGRTYMVLPATAEWQQYIHVVHGKVVHVIRAYNGDVLNRLVSAMEDKYGDPEPGSMMPQVRSNAHPFGGNVRLENRTLWHDHECNQDLELVSQQKTTISAVGGRTTQLVALVVSHNEVDEEGGSSLIE